MAPILTIISYYNKLYGMVKGFMPHSSPNQSLAWLLSMDNAGICVNSLLSDLSLVYASLSKFIHKNSLVLTI